MSEFKETGVGSRAWYIKTIKANPDRSGFSFIRNENIDGYKLNYPLLKAHMEELTAAGYFQKQGRDDSPRVKYVVTSFGHRYLEQHKDELEAIKPEPVYEKREGMYYRDKKLISRLMVPKHIADKLDGNVDGPVRVVKPASSPVQEQGSDPQSGLESTTKPETRPLDRVVHAAIEVGQEIERHKARNPEPLIPSSPNTNNEQGSDDPRINKESSAPAKESTPTPDPIQKPADKENLDKIAEPQDLIAQLKTIAGEILYERNAGLVSVKDIVEHLEKKNG